LPGAGPMQKDVPAAIQQVIARGLRDDPDDRWPSIEALLDELARDPARRRRRWAIPGGGAALIAAGAPARGGGGPAGGAGGRASGRGRGRAGLGATPLAAADALADQSIAALDAYAVDWARQREAACRTRGALSERAGDLRMACFDQRRRDLGAVVAVLARADEKTALAASDVRAALAPVSSCEDVAML